MANNKDFKVKNGIGPTVYHETVGTVTFSVENTGPTDSFSTTLYTGNGGSQTITNDIDLANDGGLVWIKRQDNTGNHGLFSSNFGDPPSHYLISNSTGGQSGSSNMVDLLSTGFSVNGAIGDFGLNNADYVSWTFKKESKFFDIVTWTGNGTSQVVSHNLGTTIGSIIIKRTDASFDWKVYHRSLGTSKELELNQTGAAASTSGTVTAVSSSSFTVGGGNGVNASNGTYVAYLFAHDTSADSYIQCGSYTTDANEDATVTLGWKPQWLLVKRSDGSGGGDWRIIDSVRGVTDAGDAAYLEANTSDAEAQTGDGRYTFTDTGFTQDNFGASRDYIYVAIREATSTDTETLDLSTGSVFEHTPTKDATYVLSNPADSGTVSNATLLLDQAGIGPNNEFSTTLYSGTGAAQTITTGIDLSGSNDGLVWVKWRSGALGSAPHVLVDTVRGVNKNLKLPGTDAEDTTNSIDSFTSTGFTLAASNGPQGGTNYSGGTYVAWTFKKAAGFFDIVTYTGTGANKTVSHSLGEIPGAIITFNRDGSFNPQVGHRSLGWTKRLRLNSNAALQTSTTYWNDTDPTSTQFTVGTSASANALDDPIVAYLFPHNDNVACGSYEGNGSSTGPEINLGWKPQWLMIKNADNTGDWTIFDSERGIPDGSGDKRLRAQTTDSESSVSFVDLLDTGFKVTSTGSNMNTSSTTYIYIAIADISAATMSYDSSIEFAGGTAPTSPAIGETDVITFSTRDGGTTYQAALSIDGAK